MIDFPERFFEVRFVDLIVPLVAFIALLVAWWQLRDIRKHRRVEFTYQLYRDFFNYLNDEKNRDIKGWLFGQDVVNLDGIKIGDLLEQFEAVWSLQTKDLVDEDIVYDLFSYYIMKASNTANPTASAYIDQLKLEEKECLVGYTDDLFVGYENLLRQMEARKSDQQRRSNSVRTFRKRR